MSKATLSVMGIENYIQARYHQSLFDGVSFPADINRETAINTILFNAGEFEVIYSNADFLREAITLWSNTMQLTFSKWVEAFKAEFSPIENYDRYDEYTDDETNKFKGNVDNNGTAEGQVSAYNSSTYQPKTKDITGNKTESENENTRKLTHKLHSHGNIGVVRASEMWTEFVELYGENNIYTMISDDFISKFCIMVY